MATRLTRKSIGAVCLGLSLVITAPSAVAVSDLLETPARDTQLATEYLLNDIAQAGERMVAVGERGHIIYSDDDGKTWIQAEVPVSVTLTALHFATPTHGWAVGHSGAVLHSSDGGETWSLQLDGIRAFELAIEAKEERVAELEAEIEQAPEEQVGDLEWALDDLLFTLENMRADLEIGPVNPFLAVWFENESHGFVVGAYGMIFRTTDGGESWRDWSGELANPTGFHLNAIDRVKGGGLVIAGEAGLIRVSTDNGETWEERESPYDGSFFGVMGTGDVNEILVFGLRGNILFSEDLGRSWDTVPTDSTATLNEGAVTPGGRIILVGNGGAVLESTDGGETFKSYFREDREGVMAVVPVVENRLILVGEQGVNAADAAGKNL
ncbi:MAG: YCF48-related protein [Marinobacter sp.]|uniref:WD40/YVTN/BNR-like repeat-containing protein n=1 Tax=Marinobacter sp. TaxID=50741 RepID=UPI00299E179E|nr:YCF48-related protein [Marinobacter sp.]MDX1633812.1 YCF48-related protein [Marinobacter sp.]